MTQQSAKVVSASTIRSEFGRAAARITRDLLLLVDVKVPLVVIREWSGWERQQANDWAGAVHAHASDNNNRVPPLPRCLKAYVTKARTKQ
jgi:hypothetical protein